MGIKGYKYKNMIAPFVSGKKVGTGINKRVHFPCTMMLNDNKIDYIHWDDPSNEIVDRLRLLDALRQTGHNNYDILISRFCRLSKSFAKPVIINNLVLHTSFSRHRNAIQQVWT